VLGLLCYPLGEGWVGLGALVALLLTRTLLLGQPFPVSPFSLPLGLYLAGAVVGQQVSVLPHGGLVRFHGLLAASVAFGLVVDLTTTTASARRLVLVVLVAMAVAAPLLVLVSSHAYDPARNLLPLSDGVVRALAAARPLAEAAAAVDAMSQRFRLAHSGLATVAAFGIALALGPLLTSQERRWRLAALLLIGYFSLWLLLASARGHLLSTAFVIGLFTMLALPKRLAGFVLLAAGAAVLLLWVGLASGLLFGMLNLQRSWAASPYTLGQRAELWENVRFLLGDFRFTGVGLGMDSVVAIYDTYFPPVGQRYFHSHNIFLQSYLEQGLLGLVGLAGLVVVGLALGWRTLRRVQTPDARAAAISGSAAALALVLCGQTDIDPVTSLGMVGLFGALGLLVAAGRLDANSDSHVRPSTPSPTRTTLSVRSARLALLTTVATLSVLGLNLALRGELSRAVGAQLSLNLGAVRIAQANLASRDSDERWEHLTLADDFLSRALAWQPENPAVYRTLAAAALAADEPDGARAMLAEVDALATDDDKQTLFQLGRLYRQADDPAGALAAWTRAGRGVGAHNRQAPDAQLVKWAVELLQASRPADAAAASRRVIELWPAHREPYPILSVALWQERGAEAALEAMQELAAANPGVPWSYDELARLAGRLGRPEAARSWRQQSVRVSESAAWTEVRRKAMAERPYPIELGQPLGWAHSDLGPATRYVQGPLVLQVFERRGARILLVENTDKLAFDLTLRMTYLSAGLPLAMATSDVSALLPGQTRAVRLRPNEPLPAGRPLEYQLGISWRSSPEGAPGVEAAPRLQFGRWEELPNLGLDVEVTNSDANTRSVALQALLYRGQRLVEIASGRVMDLAPGQTKTATLLTSEPTPPFDRILFIVDRLLS
jgi:O-antigen ligase